MLELLELGGSRQNLTTSGDTRTGKVLISNESSLIEIIINEHDNTQQNFLITVDSENLLRGWSIL